MLFPFYHEIDEHTKVDTNITDWERKLRDQDWEDSKYMMEYRRNTGWDAKAKRGMKIYNVVQTFKPTDEVSRIFLGYSRMIIDKGIEQMTEGEPDFDFEPRGPSDNKKTIIWKHLIRMLLSDCNYKAHQELFFRDYFVMGSGVMEVYVDYPKRTIRVPNDTVESGYESVVIRDFRRPKVGVRALNPLDCWRNPNIDDPTRVPSCLKRRIITWNQFAQDYGRCELPNGKLKYKNLDKIEKGTHVCVYEYQDEVRDVLRLYAKSFGNESDGMASNVPEDSFGIPIFDKPLKIHEERENGVVVRSEGLNILGMCNVRWGTYFDQYDSNYRGQHGAYGMGLPQRIEGEDVVLQTIYNMNIDNYRWANTVALNYEGSNKDSYLNLNANRLYGGELIDGTITPQPLGINRTNDFTAMQESIDRTTIPSTGINHNQLVGDTSKTAFEFAQRIKQANRGAEQRLQRLENELFKPIGSLMLAGALSEMTVAEYEDMTEEQVDAARAAIKRGEKTASDYKDLNGSKPQRRRHTWIPVKGEKMREDFSQSKKRNLDYHSTGHTLIFDKNMDVKTSYIPLVEEHVYPAEYIESGLMPDVTVDSKRMLGDQKIKNVENFKAASTFLLEMMKLGYTNLDLNKLATETLIFADIDEDKMLKNEDENSVLAQFRKAATDLETPPPPPNAQVPPQMAPQQNPGTAPGITGQPQGAPAAFEGVAAGGL